MFDDGVSVLKHLARLRPNTFQNDIGAACERRTECSPARPSQSAVGLIPKLLASSRPIVDSRKRCRCSTGIASLGLPWLRGPHEYNGVIDQVFQGLVGDVRIVDRALSPTSFLTAR